MRPDHVGDVLLSSPAVRALVHGLPGAEVTYLVGPWSAAVARHSVRRTTIETLAFPGFTRRPKANPIEPYTLLLRKAASFRQRQFDLAVILRPDHWWGALLALVAGVPLRIGARTPETAPLLTHACDLDPTQHAVEHSLAIARLALSAANVFGAQTATTLRFEVTHEARDAAAAIWHQSHLGNRVVGLQPSAGAELKLWPSGRWSALADRLIEAGFEVVLIGAPGDAPLLRSIAAVARSPLPIATGQPLDVSAALYERCVLLIGPDGGGAHVAAAVGTPTVRLYGPAPPLTFGPWPPRADQQVRITDRLACAPCGHLVDPPCGARTQPACMLALSVDNVWDCARGLLAHL